MATGVKVLIFVTFTIFHGVCGLSLDIGDIDEDFSQNRLIIGATGNVPFNATQLAAIAGLIAAALLPLLALMCLCALTFGLLLLHHGGGYGDGGYSSYGSNAYRALGLDNIDWEKLSIIDWISIGEETFRKFDPSNFDCQKRVICELHQNVKEFGVITSRIVDLFGYIKYLEIFNLPEMLKILAEEYQDAADRGRSLSKDCGEMYYNCEFSLKAMYDRYHSNDI